MAENQHMPQPPRDAQMPAHAGAAATSVHTRRRIFSWVIFIGLITFVLLLIRVPQPSGTMIALSDFAERLEKGQVASIAIAPDEVVGDFTTAQTIDGQQVTQFRAALPMGMGSDWSFVQWMLEHRGVAVISADRQSNLVLNVFIPLIPWLLIFLFIWFFVYRVLRRGQEPLRVLVVNPPE